MSPAERNQECGEAIRTLTGEQVHCVRDLRQAGDELRRGEFSVVAVDQHLWDMDPRLADIAIQASGTAALVLINPVVSGIERMAREVVAALRRREGELRRVREDAEASLRAELNEAVTGILPGAAAAKIRSVYELAMSIRERLGAKA